MTKWWERPLFGGLAMSMSASVIFLVLSPFVPDAKIDIANVVLGSALTWPGIVLAFHYGASQSRALQAVERTAPVQQEGQP